MAESDVMEAAEMRVLAAVGLFLFGSILGGMAFIDGFVESWPPKATFVTALGLVLILAGCIIIWRLSLQSQNP